MGPGSGLGGKEQDLCHGPLGPLVTCAKRWGPKVRQVFSSGVGVGGTTEQEQGGPLYPDKPRCRSWFRYSLVHEAGKDVLLVSVPQSVNWVSNITHL